MTRRTPSLPLPGARALGILLFVLCLLPARTAAPAEISAFMTGGKPGETWKAGYGGMLTITLFNLVHGEVEGAYQGSELASTSLFTASAKAYLGPSIGRFVPYAGIGAGVYLENLPGDDDQGTTGLVFAGAKLKFPMGLVLRAEYQWIDMPTPAPVQLDQRYLFSVGLGF
jgi:opacity protein-like surface antigen